MGLSKLLSFGGPAQDRPGGPSRSIILWLVAIGMAIFIIPLSVVASTVGRDIGRLEADILAAQNAFLLEPTPVPEVVELRGALSDVQGTLDQLAAVRPIIMGGRTDWQAIMAAIGNYNPDQLKLASLAQESRRIDLQGRAADDSVVVAYARALDASGLFSSVVVQSIKVASTPFVTATSVDVIPTVEPVTHTATLEPTPTITPTPVPTAAPDLRDAHEVDDFEARDIYFGEPQSHNFFPIFDVDMVTFLAKAERFYRVYTADLSPGVDTFLSVGLEGITHTNDDAEPGTLSSLIEFQVTTGYDVEALVRVTNRGAYGSDKWYQLIVKEVVPEATSTPVPASTPLPTDLPPTSTPAPTATPDLRDEFEPDHPDPPLIAVGETQLHNFYPDRDVDRVVFVARAGRDYRVCTSDLALGVDTYLEIVLDDNQWENDDYTAPGTGNLGSAVCFQAPQVVTDTALVTVSNVQQHYGPNRTYRLTISEAPILEIEPLTVSFGPVTQGAGNPAAQNVQIASTGSATLTWTAEPGASWLSLDPSSGTTPSEMSLSIDISSLTAGSYHTSIVVAGTTPCTQNTPQTIQVNLEIEQATARAPGAAMLVARNIYADPLLVGVALANQEWGVRRTLALPISRYERSALSLEAVEFVIILEIKAQP